jgi:hypothetical protein
MEGGGLAAEQPADWLQLSAPHLISPWKRPVSASPPPSLVGLDRTCFSILLSSKFVNVNKCASWLRRLRCERNEKSEKKKKKIAEKETKTQNSPHTAHGASENQKFSVCEKFSFAENRKLFPRDLKPTTQVYKKFVSRRVFQRKKDIRPFRVFLSSSTVCAVCH